MRVVVWVVRVVVRCEGGCIGVRGWLCRYEDGRVGCEGGCVGMRVVV